MQVNVYIFFNTNAGQYILFLIIIQVNVYFLLIFFIINPVLVLKKYTLTCVNDKKINKKYTLTYLYYSSLVVLYVRLTGQYFFYIKYILNLKYTKQ